jgi:hypothetical protein
LSMASTYQDVGIDSISLTGPLGLTTTLGGRWWPPREGVLAFVWFIAPPTAAPPPVLPRKPCCNDEDEGSDEG